MSETTTRYYTTIGSVRGRCGHKHHSIKTATACLMHDRRGCKSQGGYSDRDVVCIDGGKIVNSYLTTDEGETFDPEQEAR